jgi:hypothetical protein
VSVLELHLNLSGPEMLSAVQDTFKLIHQGFGKHRLKHFLADGASAWISPSKSLTNQVSAITEGHLLVLFANGEVRYHLGVEDATVFKLDKFEQSRQWRVRGSRTVPSQSDWREC